MKKAIGLLVVLVAGVVVVWWRWGAAGPEYKNQEPAAASPTVGSVQNSQTYSMDDVALHAKKSDCWMVIDGTVYDVTNYIDKHPGGTGMAGYCGADATEVFDREREHDDKARALLPQYRIGTLE